MPAPPRLVIRPATDRDYPALAALWTEIHPGDDPRALRFAVDRGFVEAKRDTPWSLDLTRFDPAPHAAARTALERAGVRLASLADLDAAGTEWRRPFWALFSEVRRDVPRAGPVRDIPFERFAEMSYAAPDFAPELALVALATEVSAAPDAMIGMSQLWRDAEAGADEAFTGLTGVVRSWRRRGVALALKVAALERAAAAGVRRVHTDNDERNAGMLAINRRLGFEAGAPILSMALEPVPPLEPG